MITMYIQLKSIDAIKEFVDVVSEIDGETELISGRYMIDAKSVIDIYNINLSGPVQLNIRMDHEYNLDRLKKFQVYPDDV